MSKINKLTIGGARNRDYVSGGCYKPSGTLEEGFPTPGQVIQILLQQKIYLSDTNILK